MANDTINFYNYYFRYLWSKADFENLQSAHADSYRGAFDGLMGGAIVDGLIITAITGSTPSYNVSVGTAISPSGKLMVLSSTENIEVTRPVTNPRRDLVVLRPLEIQNNSMTDPTNPSETVYLKVQQSCEIVTILGTAAVVPEYPEKEDDDVIICGYVVDPSANFVTGGSDFDMEVREIPGKNRSMQMTFGRYDERFMCYKAGNASIGIKPSIVNSVFAGSDRESPLGFSYVAAEKPSQYPRNSISNFVPGDSFYNLTTGSVTGSDETSSTLTPFIPGAGNYGLMLLQIDRDDKVSQKNYAFGVSQRTSAYLTLTQGGLLPDANKKLLCYVILYSKNGSAITDCEVIDARSPGNVIPQLSILPFDSTTNYGIGNIVLSAAGELYVSLAANNLNQSLTDPTKFRIYFDSVRTIENYNLTAAVSSSTLTVTLKGKLGSTLSVTNPINIGFRSTSLSVGQYNTRKIDAPLSLLISNGATLGHTSAKAYPIYVYAYDNFGTVDIAVCSTRLNEDVLHDTVLMSSSSDSSNILYAASANSSMPIRLLGKITVTQAAAGTWATAPSMISLYSDDITPPTDYSCIRLGTTSGYGSVNTAVRRFTSAIKNTGVGLEYADSATGGTSLTCTIKGRYAFTYFEQFNAGANFGLSLNSAQLTTDIVSITAADALVIGSTPAANLLAGVSITLELAPGDVVRPHSGSGVSGSAPALARLNAQRIS